MSEIKFTQDLISALTEYENGQIQEWVENYLSGEGRNEGLLKRIKEHPEAKIVVKEQPLSQLNRVMGPEDTMLWQEEPEKWQQRVDRIKKAVKQGFELPPLIVTDFWDEVHVSDGNHRLEALRQLGYEKYWTIFYLVDQKNIKAIVE